MWPQVLGVMPSGNDTLAIIASFYLVTRHGPGVATLARPIPDRRLSELREGDDRHGLRINTIPNEGTLPKLGNQPSTGRHARKEATNLGGRLGSQHHRHREKKGRPPAQL
jgi:hypothetical protein